MSEVMTGQEVLEFIRSRVWTFSKRYAEFAPHEYIIYRRLPEEERVKMKRFANTIHKFGIPLWYNGKHRHKYLWVAGHYYWTCGSQGEDDYETINRCVEDEYKMVFDFKKAKEKKEPKQMSMEDFLK